MFNLKKWILTWSTSWSSFHAIQTSIQTRLIYQWINTPVPLINPSSINLIASWNFSDISGIPHPQMLFNLNIKQITQRKIVTLELFLVTGVNPLDHRDNVGNIVGPQSLDVEGCINISQKQLFMNQLSIPIIYKIEPRFTEPIKKLPGLGR